MICRLCAVQIQGRAQLVEGPTDLVSLSTPGEESRPADRWLGGAVGGSFRSFVFACNIRPSLASGGAHSAVRVRACVRACDSRVGRTADTAAVIRAAPARPPVVCRPTRTLLPLSAVAAAAAAAVSR